jgi:O-methyltransferase
MNEHERGASLYLDLLKRSLIRWGDDEFQPINLGGQFPKAAIKRLLKAILDRADLEVGKTVKFDPAKRELGRDCPRHAETMVGMKRLNNLQFCIETVLRENIPGDFIETGVWRGGAAIFMRGAIEALGDISRIVWCADSFQGLPAPNLDTYPADENATWHGRAEMAISLDTVRANFARYGLLDERVKFLPGWFKDTLASAPIKQLAILRLDGDMYESTMDALTALYHKLSPRGFIIVDDYGIPEDTCRKAIHDFRAEKNIADEIIDIDAWGAFWRKGSQSE